MLTLKNRVAVVTGASGCIGKEIVKELVEGGMTVAVCTHGSRAAEQTISGFPPEIAEHMIALGCEMNSSADVKDHFAELSEQTGGIDVLITLHGRSQEYKEQSIETLDPEYLDFTISSHLTGNYNLIREALPYLRKSSAGRVIFTANTNALTGGVDDAMGVTAAKGATVSLTYSLARRLAADGITVNCIAIGGIANIPDTVTMNPNWIRPEEMFRSEEIPMGRVGTPQDIAAAVCYLASEEAGFVTGEVLNVSGGLFIG